MDEKENQRAAHLSILISYSIFTVVLTVESIILGWNIGAVVLLCMGMFLCWGIHVTTRVPVQFRIWIYFTLSMLAFFFYGIQKTSLFDLAPVIVLAIIMFASVEKKIFITLCVTVFYITTAYNLVFVTGKDFSFSVIEISRLILHLLLVYVCGRLIKAMISRREKRIEQTEAKIAELEEINRRTEDFLANISHELRTPINVVTGITSVMLKKEDDPAKREDIHVVQMAGMRLFSQIEDILEYTEIETGRLKVFEDDYMISSIVNDIITAKRQAQEENPNIELIFDIDAGIPSVLNGDEKKIKRIVRHLLDNAIKFTKKGGVYVRIYAVRKPYGVNLCIQVRDTGSGIEEKELAKIKERFYQSNSGRDRSTSGLGLGLPIVYGLSFAMGGFVRVESEVEKGTTFSVSIPQHVSDDTTGIYLSDKSALSLAVFLRMDKYSVSEVRDFYNEMIAHIVQGLGVSVHRVFDIGELKKLVSIYQLTHLFIGVEEYEENRQYFEEIAGNVAVIVVAGDSFALPKESRAKILQKPFYFFSVVNILNAKLTSNPLSKMKMICPSVRMLVVDDEPMNLMVAEGIFREYQMSVTLAESGKKALEICEDEEFDLIFLDHMMPEMDGVETLKRLRKLNNVSNRQLNVIAFTANAVSDAREMFMQVGFDEFVSKPIDTMELERVLRKVLPNSMIQFVAEDSKEANSYERYGKSSGTKNISLKTQADSSLSQKEANSFAEDTSQNEENSPAQKNANSTENLLSSLENAGIMTQNGLQYCRGDITFYNELLLKFAEDAAEKKEKISSYYKNLDFENYRILVHALKSTAKMIGADSLSELAKRMEDASKEKNETFIKENFDSLIEKYDKTVAGIFSSLKDETKSSQENEDSGTSSENGKPPEEMQILKEELLQKLDELKNAFSTFEEEKSLSLIKTLSEKAYGEKMLAPLFKEISDDVENFEFSAAQEKLDAIIRGISKN